MTTVFLCFIPDTGYCLMDANGYLVCAIWFENEADALTYCEKNNMRPIYYEDE